MAESLVVFEAAGVRYAVPVEQVREVLPWAAPTPLPAAPAGTLGVVKARDEVLPVVAMPVDQAGPGAPAGAPAARRLLLLEVPGGPLALAVDAVVTVANVPREQLGALPAGSGDGVTALLEVEGRPTLAVDLGALLAPLALAAR